MQQFLRGFVVGLIRRQLRRMQRVPLTVDPLQRFFQRFRCSFAHAAQGELIEAGAVHLPATLDQVVRLVGQHRDFPLIELGETEQQRAEIEVIVVVGDDHVHPTGHFLAQVIRANRMFRGDFTHGRLIKQIDAAGSFTGGRQTVIEALRQRAGFAVTGFVRVFTSLVPGNHFQHAQRQIRRLIEQHLTGVQREFAAGGFSGEEEHFVQLLRRQRLEHREQRTEGFANSGGCLRHQATPSADSLEHRFGQMPLTGTKIRMGKAQLLRRQIARLAMGHFLFSPMQEQTALLLEELSQGVDAERLDQTGFLFADDVEIHQRQIDLLQIQLATHQPAVDFRLRPVQLTVIGRLFAQIATVGFDFFEAVLRWVVAVRPALYLSCRNSPSSATSL